MTVKSIVSYATVLVIAAVTATPARAQQVSDTGVLIGLAFDSIYGGPLRGAIIRIGETGINATSDSSGRYRVSGIPRGQHRVEVIHPLLDTLRLALRTTPRDFADSTALIVGTPSTATLVALKCTPQERAQGASMALGFVTLAGSEEPVSGAIVRIEWTDYEVAGKRLRSFDRVRTATTGRDGSYKICGIPGELETGIYATMGTDTTTTLRRNFAAGLAIASFRVAPPEAASATPARGSNESLPTATISGRVVDSAGRAVAGARVATDDGRLVALSHADGSFELSGLRPGSRGINVRRLGFLPVSRPVEVSPYGTKGVEVRLAVYVPVLETVRITAQRSLSLERIGFASRSRASTGRFLGPDEIARRNPHRLTDLLRTMPILQTYYGSNGELIITGRRGECLRYYVDGQRWFEGGDTPDRFITGNEIGAVEVYTGMTAPAQYMAHERDGSSCSIVLVWTKWKMRI